MKDRNLMLMNSASLDSNFVAKKFGCDCVVEMNITWLWLLLKKEKKKKKNLTMQFENFNRSTCVVLRNQAFAIA